VSVKDRWVGPVSKYWTYWSHAGDMDPLSLIVCSSIDVCLKHTASMVVLGEKLRRVLWATESGWEVESGTLFLGISESVQLCWVSVKGCHVRGPPAGSVHVAYVDWRGKHTFYVDQVFSCRVYIDSNHHDSRIWVIACLMAVFTHVINGIMFITELWFCFTIIICNATSYLA
jgi:hypothetical protein